MLPQLFEDVAPPTTGHVYTFADSATPAQYKIPADWKGQYITITSSTNYLLVAFGDQGVSVAAGEVASSVAATSTSTSQLCSNWASGSVVPAGGSRSFPIPKTDVDYFSIVSGGTGGYYSIEVSSGTPNRRGEILPSSLQAPILWLDAGTRSRIITTAGAITVAAWFARV